MTNENPAGPVVDHDNKAISVSLYIKDGIWADGIRVGISPPHVSEVFPFGFFGDAEPGIKAALQVSVFRGGLPEPLPADYMHDAEPSLVPL